MTIGFAHRGARAYERENTMPAFRRALELGATGLESDGWLSADGEVVLVHDDVVRAGLRRLHVGRTRSDALARHHVPRLRDLYDELGTGFELSLDVKEHRAALPIVDVARAADHGAPGRLWLCSPNAAMLEEVRRTGDDVRLVHSTRTKRIDVSMERHAAELQRLRIDAINLHYTEWTKGLVALFQRFDVRAFAWDTQETRQLRAMLEMGIDAVYCDRPDRMMAAIAEWTP
jgi:glycerophosphoryl diester phosphodiesterase